ncbi:MAG: DUF4126 domain-containing protein [Actinobacteria bacterium]|nr:DUF4126 domain-containing protein [Actinomycetota bacterium]
MELLTALGLAVPAGLNAYIPLLAIALAQRFEWLALKEPFDVMGEWWMIAVIGVLLVIEIVADKVPAVDHINDIIQTFIRPAAGGVVAVAVAGSATDVSPWLLVLAGVLLAGGVHAAKATTRPAVNVTTAGFGAPVVSAAEDVGAVILSAAAIVAPILVAFLAAGLAYSFWRLWQRKKRTGSIVAEL